ncbi:MAG: hypothetical protein ACRDMZ_10440 [Solirubrobacteraceae bacterium]
MTDSDVDEQDPPTGDGNEAVRDMESRKDPRTDPPGDHEEPAGGEGMIDEPIAGGYAGRDPKTDMPAVSSIPETAGDPLTHDALPDKKERSPHD